MPCTVVDNRGHTPKSKTARLRSKLWELGFTVQLTPRHKKNSRVELVPVRSRSEMRAKMMAGENYDCPCTICFETSRRLRGVLETCSPATGKQTTKARHRKKPKAPAG